MQTLLEQGFCLAHLLRKIKGISSEILISYVFYKSLPLQKNPNKKFFKNDYSEKY